MWLKKTPSDDTLLERTSSEVFVMLVVVHSFLLFIHFQATLPCHRHSTQASHAREGPHQLWALPRLLLIAFFFIYHERYGFEWVFFTHRRFFTLCSFTDIFLRWSRPPWEPAILRWSFQGFMLILERLVRPICLFDSQQSIIFMFRRISF